MKDEAKATLDSLKKGKLPPINNPNNVSSNNLIIKSEYELDITRVVTENKDLTKND